MQQRFRPDKAYPDAYKAMLGRAARERTRDHQLVLPLQHPHERAHGPRGEESPDIRSRQGSVAGQGCLLGLTPAC
jgi:hypothetical protein